MNTINIQNIGTTKLGLPYYDSKHEKAKNFDLMPNCVAKVEMGLGTRLANAHPNRIKIITNDFDAVADLTSFTAEMADKLKNSKATINNLSNQSLDIKIQEAVDAKLKEVLSNYTLTPKQEVVTKDEIHPNIETEINLEGENKKVKKY